MAKFVIEWLTDSTDCDQAGCSGGWAEGAIVHRDGADWLRFIPRASCFGSQDDWRAGEIYKAILAGLGHEVTEIE